MILDENKYLQKVINKIQSSKQMIQLIFQCMIVCFYIFGWFPHTRMII